MALPEGEGKGRVNRHLQRRIPASRKKAPAALDRPTPPQPVIPRTQIDMGFAPAAIVPIRVVYID